MTEEEKEALLKEARERYPVGTIFKSVRTGSRLEVTKNNPTFTADELYNNEYGVLYSKGKWAEIISTPTPVSLIDSFNIF